MDTEQLELFKQDPYRAAASMALVKEFEDVTLEERHHFKTIVMGAIYGRRRSFGLDDPQMAFEDMYACQRLFTEKVLSSRDLDLSSLSDRERTDLTREYLLSLHAELTEVLQNTDWKKHRSEPEKINSNNVRREIIDVQKFLWGLALIWEMNEEEFCREFWAKSKLVEDRFHEELARKERGLVDAS